MTLSFVEVLAQCHEKSTAGTEVCKMVAHSLDAAVLHVVCRASGQALAGTIALQAADGDDKCLLEARLWLTASRGTIDTIFDMLSKVNRVLFYAKTFITKKISQLFRKRLLFCCFTTILSQFCSDSQTLTDTTSFVCGSFCVQLL